jgi:hypothetical protein
MAENTEICQKSYKGPCLLSKKKYKELRDHFANTVNDDEIVNNLLEKLCEVLKFDPELGIYNKERGKRMIEYRNKKAEEAGLTIYAWRKQNKK